MRNAMGIRVTKVVILSLVLLLGAAVSHADGVPAGDPLVRVGGGDPPAPAFIITQDFTVSSASGSSPATSPCVLAQPAGSATPIVTVSPACFFENAITTSGTGNFIDEIRIDFGNLDPSTVNCGSVGLVIFSNCSVSGDGHGGTLVDFTGGVIPFTGQFFLEMDGFAPNTTGTFSAQLPEPGTLGMLGLGLVGIGLRRKRNLKQAA